MRDFKQTSSYQLSYHTETFVGNGPFQLGKAFFASKEEWLEHSEGVIRALNLDCVSIDPVLNGYKFGFTNLPHMLLFDYVAVGERLGEYNHKENIPEVDYLPYWQRAVAAHLNDKGIKADMAVSDGAIEIKMYRKGDFVSFHLAKDEINSAALQNYRDAHPGLAPNPS